MQQRYEIGQSVFFMENNKPVERKIYAIIQYDEGSNYLFSNEKSPSNPDKFWLHRQLEDKTTYMKYESEIFETGKDLKNSLFNRIT